MKSRTGVGQVGYHLGVANMTERGSRMLSMRISFVIWVVKKGIYFLRKVIACDGKDL
jgi:hypothetical protein